MGEGGGPAIRLHLLFGSWEEKYLPCKDVTTPATRASSGLPKDIMMRVFSSTSFVAQMRAKVVSKEYKKGIETADFRLQSTAAGMPLPAAICAFEVIGDQGGPDDLHHQVSPGEPRTYYPSWAAEPAVQQRTRRCTGKVDKLNLDFLPQGMQGLLTSRSHMPKVQFFGNGMICIKRYGSEGCMVLLNVLNRTWRKLQKPNIPEILKERKLYKDKEEEISCHVHEKSATFKVVHFFQWSDYTGNNHTWCAGIYTSVTNSWKVVQGASFRTPRPPTLNHPGTFVRAFTESRLYTLCSHANGQVTVHSLDDGTLLEAIHPRAPPKPILFDLRTAGLKNLASPHGVQLREWKGIWWYRGNLYAAVTYLAGGDILLGVTILHPDRKSWGTAKLLRCPPWHNKTGWQGLTCSWDENYGQAGQYIWVARYYMNNERRPEASHSRNYSPPATPRTTDEIRHDWHTLALYDTHQECWLELFSDIRDKKSCKLSVFEPKAVHIHLSTSEEASEVNDMN